MKICALMIALVATPPAEYEELIAPWSGETSPGGFIGVVRADGDDLEIPFGMANLEEGRAMDARTAVYVASVAKTFTAACALHAAEAGHLSLDAPIAPMFPELSRDYSAITTRHLMDHRSGVLDMYDTAIVCDLSASSYGSNAAVIEMISKLSGSSFEPGSRFLYSNSGYVLLAEAVARSSKGSFAEYVRTNVFEPAGMEDAHCLGEQPRGRVAIAYARTASGWTPRDVRTGTVGPGGLFLSGRDLMQFARANPPATMPAFIPDGPHNPRVGRYGGGLMRQSIGDHRIIRHFGGAFGFGADLLWLPDDGIAIVAVVNTDAIDVTDLTEAVARIELGDRFRERAPLETAALTTEQRRRFGRFWKEAASGRIWVVSDKGEHFTVASLGDLKLTMVAVSADRLEATDGHVPFAMEIDGERLVIRHDDGSTTPLEAVPFPTQNRADPAEVAGRYTCAALGATVELQALPNGMIRLLQDDPLIELTPFIPLDANTLVCDRGAQIDLRRDAEDRVTGLVMSANRAWGLEFERSGGP